MVWYGMVCFGMVCFGMVWYGMAYYDTLQFGMAWHGMIWHGRLWHGMVWFNILYGIFWCVGILGSIKSSGPGYQVIPGHPVITPGILCPHTRNIVSSHQEYCVLTVREVCYHRKGRIMLQIEIKANTNKNKEIQNKLTC